MDKHEFTEGMDVWLAHHRGVWTIAHVLNNRGAEPTLYNVYDQRGVERFVMADQLTKAED